MTRVSVRLTPAHRRACLSLYRALLQKLNRLVLPDVSTISVSKLSSAISSQFRRDRTLKSRDDIISALSRGRAVHALLSPSVSITNNPSLSLCSSDVKKLEALATIAAGSPHTQLQNQGQNRRHGDHQTHSDRLNDVTVSIPPASPAAETQEHLGKPSHDRPSRATSKLKRKSQIESQRNKFWAERVPIPIPILQRPVSSPSDLPDPTRPRKVPRFIVAQGVPFLRYKSGPQSPVLSRILRQYYRRDQRRWDLVARFTDEIGVAEAEDRWDEILLEEWGVREEREEGAGEGEEHVQRGGGNGKDVQSNGINSNRYASRDIEGPNHVRDEQRRKRAEDFVTEMDRMITGVSWAAELRSQMKTLQRDIKAVAAKRRNMGQRLWNIVVQEKELAEKEKVERREKRKKEREELQNVGAGADTGIKSKEVSLR